jgi:hypothetical protein
VNGLSTLLPWATAIEITDTEGASAWPIMMIEETDSIWGESQWIEFWSMPQTQRDRLQNPPAPTEGRDATDGPWTIAAAAERIHPSGSGLQRLVVVGGTGWFFDVYTQGFTNVDGRTVLTSPGNLELFEASIHWLAEQEDLVGASARAADAPRIAPLQASQLTALRWALGAGLPFMVLALGVSVRLYRG